jgi:hypothetical protein
MVAIWICQATSSFGSYGKGSFDDEDDDDDGDNDVVVVGGGQVQPSFFRANMWTPLDCHGGSTFSLTCIYYLQLFYLLSN